MSVFAEEEEARQTERAWQRFGTKQQTVYHIRCFTDGLHYIYEQPSRSALFAERRSSPAQPCPHYTTMKQRKVRQQGAIRSDRLIRFRTP